MEYLKVLDLPEGGDPSDEDAEPSPDLRKVDRYTLQIEFNQAQRWLKDLWQALADSPRTFREEAGMVQMDGTTYEIRVKTFLSEQTLRVRDSEASPDEVVGRAAIVHWANALIAELPVGAF